MVVVVVVYKQLAYLSDLEAFHKAKDHLGEPMHLLMIYVYIIRTCVSQSSSAGLPFLPPQPCQLLSLSLSV